MTDMLSVEAALDQLLAAAVPVIESQTLPAETALGLILAAPLVSGVNVPPLDNSAMDGYALRHAECVDGAGEPQWLSPWLPISQRIPAGHPGQPLQAGTAARIFTGAPIPDGADCVVMQEDCEAGTDEVRVMRPPKPGANIRRAGEDIQIGQTVLEPGARLGPAQLGVAASIGETRLTVYRRLKAAVFFTGDEIVLPGEPLGAGRIYNSNRATLIALLNQLGIEVIDLGQIGDNFDATLVALQRASAVADVVITSGGVSVGEEDHVKAAVEKIGRIDLWNVSMKPGKPLAHGRIGNVDFIGLPGNPVSAFVVFCLFVRPFLLKRMGAIFRPPAGFHLPAGFTRAKPGRRREFMRARIEMNRAVLFPNQSSGVLTSLAWADGLVDVDAGVTVNVGDPVRFIPLSELLA
ncbi:MAG: molybdopterin molybdenumtransferase MoeA [Hydrogenophilales bacterium 28-61-23]|nr:MAG: molybdopterin molybdenumtransferase MoeA [Hydrogenophilales bacterium 28-61-23]